MPYATTSFVLRACRSLTRFISPCDAMRADAVASTTSHPAFVTTRDRPSCRNGMAAVKHLIWGFGKSEFYPSCQFVATRRVVACSPAVSTNPSAPTSIWDSEKSYSRPAVSGSSVSVIASPVRVAPMPKVIAHVPTNIIITTSGVGL